MREYNILTVLLVAAVPAFAAETRASGLDGAWRQGGPSRLDLQVASFGAAPAVAVEATAAFRPAASMLPRDATAALPQASYAFPADAARGVLTWVLPSGMRFLAATAFGSTALLGDAAWPVGGAVPAAKTSAAVAMTLNGARGEPMALNLSVTRNWQLDAPIGGTYLDCVVRLDLSPDPLKSVGLQAPCNGSGHFGVSMRRRF